MTAQAAGLLFDLHPLSTERERERCVCRDLLRIKGSENPARRPLKHSERERCDWSFSPSELRYVNVMQKCQRTYLPTGLVSVQIF